MGEEDQRMRLSGKWDASLDFANTAQLKRVVRRIGLPTISKVGTRAHHFSWIIAQHADHDVSFQKSYLKLLKSNPSRDIEIWQIAFLEDRISVSEGKPQCYGTQFHKNEHGKFVLYPVQDLAEVNKRRGGVGLEPLNIKEYSAYFERKHRTHKNH